MRGASDTLALGCVGPAPESTVSSPARPRRESRPTTARESPTVLICDRRPVLRLGLRAILTEIGTIGDCTPVRVADAVRALRPDVVVVVARIGEGLATVTDVARTDTAIPVVVLIERVDELDTQGAVISGAASVLSVEAPTAEILDVVRRTMAGERIVPEPTLGGGDDRGTREVQDTTASPRLSARDLDVLELVAAGMTNEAVAAQLGMAPRTVKTHVQHLIERLGAVDRTSAVTAAFRLGLLR